MKEYILGNKIISTTPERYESTFKDMGYVPYNKKEEKVENKKSKLPQGEKNQPPKNQTPKKTVTKKEVAKKTFNDVTPNNPDEIKKD